MERRTHIHVAMFEWVVCHTMDAKIQTDGLANCFAVAVASGDVAALLHAPSHGGTVDALEGFLKALGSISKPTRGNIRPVVAGGSLETFDLDGPTEDESVEAVIESIRLARLDVVRRLREEGYGQPIEAWNSPEVSQSVTIDVHLKTVTVQPVAGQRRVFEYV